MDSSVNRDISDVSATTSPTSVLEASCAEPAPARSVRRFAFDPASSPVLVAAFAWDTPGARD